MKEKNPEAFLRRCRSAGRGLPTETAFGSVATTITEAIRQAIGIAPINMKLLRLFALLFGVLCIVAGAMELKLRLRSSANPTEYSVSSLERGAQVSNLLAVIDSHYAIYSAMVFEYKTKDTKARPTGNEFVQHIWYPIISGERYMNGSANPSFRIIIKESVGVTKVRDLPAGIQRKRLQTGMFLDGFHALRGEERRLLQSSFPNVDFTGVLLFEVGRKRSTLAEVVGLFAGGLLLVAVPGAWWIRQARAGRKQREIGATRSGSQPIRPEDNPASSQSGPRL